MGLCGQLPPAAVRSIDGKHPVYVAELDAALLQKALHREVKFDEIPRYPAVTRDIALEVPVELGNGKIEDFLGNRKEPLLAGAVLFDVFADASGEKLATNKKSLAYSLTYRDSARTLNAAEVDAAHGRIVSELLKAFPVSLR